MNKKHKTCVKQMLKHVLTAKHGADMLNMKLVQKLVLNPALEHALKQPLKQVLKQALKYVLCSEHESPTSL